MRRTFHIIGMGMGTNEMLTQDAVCAIEEADRVFSSSVRFQVICPKSTVCSVSEMASVAISDNAASTAILVSGDVGFYSMASALWKCLQDHGDVVLHSGISSMQYLTAKIGVPYQDVYAMSLHGRAGSVLGAVSHHKKVFVLTGGEQSPQSICAALARADLGNVMVWIGENLASVQERIVCRQACACKDEVFDALSVMLICNDAPADAFAPVRDADIVRGDVPMTKEDIRFAVLGRMPIAPSDTVWDIGAGTGAMTIALAKRAYLGAVYAVERNDAAVQLIAENRRAFGEHQIQIIHAKAPEGLADLPAPDHVFVGGASGNLQAILQLALEKNPHATVVITAIALESALGALQTLEALQVENIACAQISSAQGKKVAGYTMMLANNPIFIISRGGKG